MIGILTGIEAEAKAARIIPDSDVVCAGARPQKARWLARDLIQRGAKRLISFGIAGGLEPGLPVGSMVIGAQVSSADGTLPCDRSWMADLVQKFPEAHCGPVWGSEKIVGSARDKRALYEKSRCLIVDMESQCAAQIAAEAGVPLAVLRVVCDSVDMDVPPVVMAVIDENGGIHIGRALWHIARHPGQIPDLFGMARGTSRAMGVLKSAAKAMGG